MLYECHKCSRYSFHTSCPHCGPNHLEDYVPLHPKYYPEFQYESQGLIKDIFIKKRKEQELGEKLDVVLEKWSKLERPYFVNYLHLAGPWTEKGKETTEHAPLDLFHHVLVRLGFNELTEHSQLTKKLVRSTSFRFRYADFVERTKHHVRSDLKKTLRSWIEERGSAYRQDLWLMLYFLYEQGNFLDEIGYQKKAPPLVANNNLNRIYHTCESIYLTILIERFQLSLEQFDPTRFVTIYAIDSMSGFEFEDFLCKLFCTIGYDVEPTKRTGDQGADLFVTKFGRRMVIQAKNYVDNVGNGAVQEALAAKAFYSCDDAMVITNCYFTSAAKELAESAGVRLVDRRGLETYLDDYNRALMQMAASGYTQKVPQG